MTEYLTFEGWQKLKKELDYLEKVKRKEIAEKLKQAATQGDLKENAEYDAAKEEQSFVEGRIQELKQILAQTEIIKPKSDNKAQLGSTVELVLKDGKKKKEKFLIMLVGPAETDLSCNKISIQSPLGQALINKQTGDIVEVETPAGRKKYQIVKIL